MILEAAVGIYLTVTYLTIYDECKRNMKLHYLQHRKYRNIYWNCERFRYDLNEIFQ